MKRHRETVLTRARSRHARELTGYPRCAKVERLVDWIEGRSAVVEAFMRYDYEGRDKYSVPFDAAKVRADWQAGGYAAEAG